MKKCLPFTHKYVYVGNKDGNGRIGDGATVMWKHKCIKCGKETLKSRNGL
ncbi:hypothetical protein [Bacillus phage vB_BanS-Thrax3]|nr:hypothetical protein [Bacillus phage vB_BanS-Thrax3]